MQFSSPRFATSPICDWQKLALSGQAACNYSYFYLWQSTVSVCPPGRGMGPVSVLPDSWLLSFHFLFFIFLNLRSSAYIRVIPDNANSSKSKMWEFADRGRLRAIMYLLDPCQSTVSVLIRVPFFANGQPPTGSSGLRLSPCALLTALCFLQLAKNFPLHSFRNSSNVPQSYFSLQHNKIAR